LKKLKLKLKLYVKFPADLRASLAMKLEDASRYHKWTAFVNNKGTLVHIVCPEGEFLIRMAFRTRLNRFDSSWIELIIRKRLQGLLEL